MILKNDQRRSFLFYQIVHLRSACSKEAVMNFAKEYSCSYFGEIYIFRKTNYIFEFSSSQALK